MAVSVPLYSHPLKFLSSPSTCYPLPSLARYENGQVLFIHCAHAWAVCTNLLFFGSAPYGALPFHSKSPLQVVGSDRD